MGIKKNGFIDLGNNFYINEDLVENINGDIITLKNGETYKKYELTKPDFLMNDRFCYDLYGTYRKDDYER